MTKTHDAYPLERDPDLIEIFIDQLEVQANLGVYAHERGRTQPVLLSIRIWADVSPKSDDLDETLDYNVFADAARRLGETRHFDLVESYLSALADEIMTDKRAAALSIRAGKPEAIDNALVAGAAIHRRR